MKKNKNLGISLIIILVVIVIIRLINANSASVNNNSQMVDSTEDISAGSVNVATPLSAISYAEALVKYKDARLQFDVKCQANPSNIAYKNNSSIMIDNHVPVPHVVKIGSPFPVKAYGFKIVKLSSAKLPTILPVDCDKSQNVATVLIQK